MKIVVTGAAGFIGYHLSDTLANQGHEVLALDALLDFPYPRTQKVENWKSLQQSEPIIHCELSDLRDPTQIPNLSGYDLVIHLAAIPGLNLSWEDTKLYIDCNILGTANLLQACVSGAVPRFFQISTSSVYGKLATGSEDSPLNPASPYGVTKLSAEQMVSAICQSYKIDYSIFRLFSVYGPGQRSDMAFNIFIDRMLQEREIKIYGDGSQSRANTYVMDVVDALIKGIQKSKNGEVYNICGSEQKSVMDVIDVLSEILETRPRIVFSEYRRGDQIETRSVASKAFRDLGFTPSTNIQTGLMQQVKWQKNKL